MNVFSTLGVFISLILAVAISIGLSGMAYLIGHRKRVTWTWVFIVWGIFFVIDSATYWWDFIATWRDLPSYFIYEFWFMLASPLTLFLLSALMFQSFPSTGQINLWARFEDMRPWFYTLAAIHALLFVASQAFVAVKKSTPFAEQMSVSQVVMTVVIATLLQAGAFIRSRAYHRIVVIIVVALFGILYTVQV